MAPCSTTPLRQRPADSALACCLGLFAFTSLVMEMYVVFDVDLARATDPLGRAWHYYASRWDPIFLDPPLWLRIMCAIDGFVFGPTYLLLVHGLWRGCTWIRGPGLLLVGAVVYSTLVYFAYEIVAEAHRADLTMVFFVNLPYTIVPILLGFRLRRAPLFPPPAHVRHMAGRA